MTNDMLLQDAIGLINEQFISEVTDLPAPHTAKKPSLIKIATIAACLCLMIGTALSVIAFFRHSSPPDVSDPEFSINVDQYIWSTEAEQSGNIPSSESADDWYAKWEGWSVTNELYHALENADYEVLFAISVGTKSDPDAMKKFEYNGITYDEIITERLNWEQRWNKLIHFEKTGEYLKYGEALYTTGTPDGERWSKQLYDSEVAQYGELIDEYIVDGELLSEKLQQDAADAHKQIEAQGQLLKDFLAAYHKQATDDATSVFIKTGVTYCVRNDTLYLFVSKQQLKDINIPSKSKYVLGLARKRVFEVDADKLPVELDHSVSGFDLEKMHLYCDGKTIQPSSDSQVITAIEDMIKLWQYTDDYLEIHVDSTFDLSDPENQLDFLKYDTISHYKFNKSQRISIYLNIKYEDLDMQALQQLSNMEEITYIHISYPLIPVPA